MPRASGCRKESGPGLVRQRAGPENDEMKLYHFPARGGSRPQTAADVVIKPNNCMVREQCAVCGQWERPSAPFAAYAADRWVCHACLNTSDVPFLGRCLEILNGAAIIALEHERDFADGALTAIEKQLDLAIGTRAPSEEAGDLGSIPF